MKHIIDRVAYRFAGVVWTLLYAGLCNAPKPIGTSAGSGDSSASRAAIAA